MRIMKRTLTIDEVWKILDLLYKSGFTKKDMKFFVDTWWKVSDALGTKYK
jgi:hypothetical protein